MQIALAPIRVPGKSRLQALAGSACIVTLAALAVLLIDTGAIVGGTVLDRLAVPGRMLLLVLVATLLLRGTGESWRDVGFRAPPSIWRPAALVVGGYAAVGIAFALAHQILLPVLNLETKTATVFSAVRGDLGEYLYWLFPVAWGSAAFGEELVFRGFLQTRLERLTASVRGAAVIAAFGQALIFGALHAYQGAGGAIVAALTGLVMGAVYILGGRNLWACILLHGVIDTVSLTALYLGAVG